MYMKLVVQQAFTSASIVIKNCSSAYCIWPRCIYVYVRITRNVPVLTLHPVHQHLLHILKHLYPLLVGLSECPQSSC